MRLGNTFARRRRLGPLSALALIGISIAVIACGQSSNQCALAPNCPTPSVTTMVTSSPTRPSPVPPNWRLALSDPLTDRNSAHEWDIGADGLGTDRELTEKGYRLTAPANGNIEGLANNPQDTFTDFIYQVTVSIQSGTTGDGGGAGLIFRSDEDGNDYSFTMDVNGGWSLERYQNSDPPLSTVLKDGSEADPIFRTGFGQTNIIMVAVVGNTITPYINNHALASASDNLIRRGLVGVAVNGSTAPAAAVFSDARVWIPPTG